MLCYTPLAARTQQQQNGEQQESRESCERSNKSQLPFSQYCDLWPHGPWPQHSTQQRSHYTSHWWVAFIDQTHLTAEAGYWKMDRKNGGGEENKKQFDAFDLKDLCTW